MDRPVLLFHASSLSFYLTVFYYDLKVVDDIERAENSTVYWSRYLTIWSMIGQLVYFAISILENLLGLSPGCKEVKGKLKLWANYLFTSIAAPVPIYVTFSYWAIYAMDKDMISSDERRQLTPEWINHSLHTFNVLFSFVDMFIIKHDYSSHKKGMTGLTIFYVLYSINFYGTYFQYQCWIYPFFGYLSIIQRAIWSICVYFLLVGSYTSTVIIHKVFWGDGEETGGVLKGPKKKGRKETSNWLFG